MVDKAEEVGLAGATRADEELGRPLVRGRRPFDPAEGVVEQMVPGHEEPLQGVRVEEARGEVGADGGHGAQSLRSSQNPAQ